jgi:hypothetical protein
MIFVDDASTLIDCCSCGDNVVYKNNYLFSRIILKTLRTTERIDDICEPIGSVLYFDLTSGSARFGEKWNIWKIERGSDLLSEKFSLIVSSGEILFDPMRRHCCY